MALQAKPTDFGAMTTNLAAAIGVKTAIQTVNKATQTLDQQCELQEKMAEEMGGIGQDSGQGLIALELHTQVNAAKENGQAITDEAFGSLASGIVGAIGVGASVGVFKMTDADESLKSELENGESFKEELNDTNESANLTIQEERTPSAKIATDLKTLKTNLEKETFILDKEDLRDQIEAKGKELASAQKQEDFDAQVSARIAKWKGSEAKDPDFSNFKKTSDKFTEEEHEEAKINRAALEKVKTGEPKVKAEINHNIERNIGRLKQETAQMKSQRQLNYNSMISQQITPTGTNVAQGGGKMAQAKDSIASQTNSAFGSVLDKAVQNTTQQLSTAAQNASTDQSEIANVLQNIAFPA